MERVPEPDLMDDDEQARAYAFADFAEPHEAFVDAFQRCFPSLAVDGVVLDLGCGPADISIRFARRFPRCHVHGIDGAPAMLRYGEELTGKAGLKERVRLVQGYLPDDEPPLASYDAVITNSLLHHLEQPAVLWRSVARYARAGAPVFVMDLMRPSSREQAQAFVDEYAADEPDVLRHDFFHSLLAAYSVDEVRAQLADAGLDDALQVAAESDRHLIVWGRAPGSSPR
jgi:SAM-dependent methyltransferase